MYEWNWDTVFFFPEGDAPVPVGEGTTQVDDLHPHPRSVILKLTNFCP